MAGQAMISSVVFFVLISLVIISGLVSPVVRDFKIASDAIFSKKSFFLAESGIEDAHYRLLSGTTHLDSGSYDIYIGSDYVTVNTGFVVAASQRTISAVGNTNGRKRSIEFKTFYKNSTNFQSGMQFGKGGLYFQGSSAWVVGNIVSAGPVTGTNTNLVTNGGVISSGSNGLVNNIRLGTVGNNVYAHNISNSFVTGDAYYVNISNTTVNGMHYPNSPDPVTYPLPITDKMIDSFKQIAQNGGTYSGSCPYNISSGIVNLGPIKIPCSSLNITGSATVNINGPVWVTGDINVSSTANVLVGGGPDAPSVPIIADNPLNRISSSKISLNTSATLTGSGANSYIMFISQNNDAESGGLQDAIVFRNAGASSKLLAYAPHGHINIQTTGTSNVLQIIAGYKATLTTFNTALSAKPTPTIITFPTNTLNIWSFEQWKEI